MAESASNSSRQALHNENKFEIKVLTSCNIILWKKLKLNELLTRSALWQQTYSRLIEFNDDVSFWNAQQENSFTRNSLD